MKIERTKFGRQVLIALAIGCLQLSCVQSKDIRLEWAHDGTCQSGYQECPISHYKIYLSSTGDFDKEKPVGSTPKNRPEERFYQLSVPEDRVIRYLTVTAVGKNGVESGYSNTVAAAFLGLSVRLDTEYHAADEDDDHPPVGLHEVAHGEQCGRDCRQLHVHPVEDRLELRQDEAEQHEEHDAREDHNEHGVHHRALDLGPDVGLVLEESCEPVYLAGGATSLVIKVERDPEPGQQRRRAAAKAYQAEPEQGQAAGLPTTHARTLGLAGGAVADGLAEDLAARSDRPAEGRRAGSPTARAVQLEALLGHVGCEVGRGDDEAFAVVIEQPAQQVAGGAAGEVRDRREPLRGDGFGEVGR